MQPDLIEYLSQIFWTINKIYIELIYINSYHLMGKTELSLLALLAITAITLYTLGDKHTTNPDFEIWKQKYGKTYSPQEEAYRLSIWLKNL